MYPKKTLKNTFVQKKFSHRKFHRTHWKLFWLPCQKKFCLKPGKNPLKTEYEFDNLWFFETLFFVKKVLWHVEGSFGNPAESFESKLGKTFAQIPKTVVQLKILLEQFSPKWSSGHIKRRFNKLAEKMSPKIPKNYSSETERGYLTKNSLKSNVHPEMALPARWIHFLHPCRKVVTENQKTRSKSDIVKISAI